MRPPVAGGSSADHGPHRFLDGCLVRHVGLQRFLSFCPVVFRQHEQGLRRAILSGSKRIAPGRPEHSSCRRSANLRFFSLSAVGCEACLQAHPAGNESSRRSHVERSGAAVILHPFQSRCQERQATFIPTHIQAETRFGCYCLAVFLYFRLLCQSETSCCLRL